MLAFLVLISDKCRTVGIIQMSKVCENVRKTLRLNFRDQLNL